MTCCVWQGVFKWLDTQCTAWHPVHEMARFIRSVTLVWDEALYISWHAVHHTDIVWVTWSHSRCSPCSLSEWWSGEHDMWGKFSEMMLYITAPYSGTDCYHPRINILIARFLFKHIFFIHDSWTVSWQILPEVLCHACNATVVLPRPFVLKVHHVSHLCTLWHLDGSKRSTDLCPAKCTNHLQFNSAAINILLVVFWDIDSLADNTRTEIDGTDEISGVDFTEVCRAYWFAYWPWI